MSDKAYPWACCALRSFLKKEGKIGIQLGIQTKDPRQSSMERLFLFNDVTGQSSVEKAEYPNVPFLSKGRASSKHQDL